MFCRSRSGLNAAKESTTLHGTCSCSSIPAESILEPIEVSTTILGARSIECITKASRPVCRNLSGNQLEGQIPENISSCMSLNYYNAHGNHLNGTIPPDLQKLDSLTY
eukprot:c16820_g1_i2 orf=2-322(-)